LGGEAPTMATYMFSSIQGTFSRARRVLATTKPQNRPKRKEATRRDISGACVLLYLIEKSHRQNFRTTPRTSPHKLRFENWLVEPLARTSPHKPAHGTSEGTGPAPHKNPAQPAQPPAQEARTRPRTRLDPRSKGPKGRGWVGWAGGGGGIRRPHKPAQAAHKPRTTSRTTPST